MSIFNESRMAFADLRLWCTLDVGTIANEKQFDPVQVAHRTLPWSSKRAAVLSVIPFGGLFDLFLRSFDSVIPILARRLSLDFYEFFFLESQKYNAIYLCGCPCCDLVSWASVGRNLPWPVVVYILSSTLELSNWNHLRFKPTKSSAQASFLRSRLWRNNCEIWFLQIIVWASGAMRVLSMPENWSVKISKFTMV